MKDDIDYYKKNTKCVTVQNQPNTMKTNFTRTYRHKICDIACNLNTSNTLLSCTERMINGWAAESHAKFYSFTKLILHLEYNENDGKG